MHKHETLEQLSRHLRRLGCPVPQAKRLVEETRDHLEDATEAGLEAGLDRAAAQEQAIRFLGDPAHLAGEYLRALRTTSWWGRHRAVNFFLLPALCLPMWFVGWISLAYGLARLFGLSGVGIPGTEPNVELVRGTAYVLYYSGVLIVPLCFCWLAYRKACGWAAMWMSCASCGLHALVHDLSIGPHHLSWTYNTLFAPNWFGLLAPLGAGLFIWAIAHLPAATGPRPGLVPANRIAAVAVICLLPLAQGCASKPKPRERGWIGGEYKVACTPRVFAPPKSVQAFPKDLAKRQRSGLLITALGTNTPAYLAGLRAGDLVLAVEANPVTKPSPFWQRIEAAKPGTSLRLTAHREGETRDYTLPVGKETYINWRALTIGTPVLRGAHLWPPPDFSLIAAGFRVHPERSELGSAESQYVIQCGRRNNPAGGASSITSREGWTWWIPIIQVSAYKEILSQEPSGPGLASR
jgi:hypothetical protein